MQGWSHCRLQGSLLPSCHTLGTAMCSRFRLHRRQLLAPMNQVALYMVTTYLNRIRRARGASRWLGVDKAIWSSLGRYMSYPIKALKSLPQHQYVSFIDSKECSSQLFTNLVHWGPASCRCTKWFRPFRLAQHARQHRTCCPLTMSITWSVACWPISACLSCAPWCIYMLTSRLRRLAGWKGCTAEQLLILYHRNSVIWPYCCRKSAINSIATQRN